MSYADTQETGGNPGGGPERYLVISSDCHAGAPAVAYRPYLDPKHRAAFDAWTEAFDRRSIRFGGTRVSGEGEAAKAARDATEAARAGGLHGAWDAALRSRELDREGLAGEVVFPDASLGNHAPFGAGLADPKVPVAPELVAAGARAHNRWLADFLAHEPERHAGIAIVAVHDEEVAAADVEYAHELGHKGVMIPPQALTVDDPNAFYHHRRFDRVWRACEELEMPLHVHAGGLVPDYGENPGSRWITTVEVYMTSHRLLWFLILGGALERHPNLKVVITEAGAGALPYYLDLLDYLAAERNPEALQTIIPRKPSEYFRRQCYIGASDPAGRSEIEQRHAIGVDKLMWGSDYPHLEGTWPHSVQRMQAMFADVPRAEVAQMVGLNALDLYGFDFEQLRAIADRVGPVCTSLGQQQAVPAR